MTWFARGGVVGSKEYVSGYLTDYRQRTKLRENITPRGFAAKKSGGWEDLYAMRARS
jgi:hypothetical protein